MSGYLSPATASSRVVAKLCRSSASPVVARRFRFAGRSWLSVLTVVKQLVLVGRHDGEDSAQQACSGTSDHDT